IFSFDFLTAHLFLKKLKSSSEKNSGVKNSILNYKKILDLYNPNVKLRLNISDVCLYYEMKSEIELNLDKKFVLPYVVSQNMDRGLLKERLPNLKDDNSNLLYIGSEVLYANKMGFLSAFVEKPFGVDINNLSSHLGGITLNLNGLGEDAKSYFLINDRKQYLTCVKKLILNGFLPPKNEYYGNLENSVLDSIRFEHMKLRMNMRAHNS
ncbi:hypothetical protein HOK68_01260, partial [Candidatus Woesearchaeota archaeon]|nr:hypothetical protein [Candidatus Woesearchaeota archaeon]